MHLTPDQMIFWQYGFLKLNGTIVFTWALMFVLAAGSKLVTRNLSTDLTRSRWQNLLEIVVTGIAQQIGDVGSAIQKSTSASWELCFYSSPPRASAPSFPVTNPRPAPFPPQRRSR